MRTFLSGLDEDIRRQLMIDLRNLWTHTSTAIEGNTLTLGETALVLEQGLTVSGKPLKDHQEVLGHARAIQLLYGLVNQEGPVGEQDLFTLHQAVQTGMVVDLYRPVGAWKKEPNCVYTIRDGKTIFNEFADPQHVPLLMKEWLTCLNSYKDVRLSQDEAVDAYAKLHVSFVRIHPFFDGNGRMARLLANLPVLWSGQPPIVIPTENRSEYVRLLSDIDAIEGQAAPGGPLFPPPERLTGFRTLCAAAWASTRELVEAAHERQRVRDNERAREEEHESGLDR
ncbi:MAG: Fic family protein [Thermaerobacter sp.]|jgi:Fic family protein|nr:Fic family protein [Thermaerobacter sp.]